MKSEFETILKEKMDDASFAKIEALNNDEVCEFISFAVGLCEPDTIWVGDDSDADSEYCRQLAIDNSEEIPLTIKGHTVHFD